MIKITSNIKKQDKKSLYEAEYVMQEMQKIGFDDYQLIYNTPGISKKKSTNARFVIKLNNYFLLKVVKIGNIYSQIIFYPVDYDYENADHFIDRDLPLSFFDVLCELYDDVYYNSNYGLPEEFKDTLACKTFYIMYFDNENRESYGLQLVNSLKLIKEKLNIIVDLVKRNEKICFGYLKNK